MLPGVAKRVVLHIGAMKSGTSFIQNVLHRNRAALAEHEILFVFERWRHQVLAVHELMDHGGPEQPPFPPDGHWRRMVESINEWPGTAIVSMEFLAPRQRPKIEIIKEAFADSDIQVVLTARDLARNLPAMWTESMQNRGTKTWEEFLEAVRSGEKGGQWFWRNQNITGICERWSEAVGRDHFTLITVPPKGAAPSLLWDRFASVAGIPTGICDLEVRSNPGIDAASAMVLRALNERLKADGFNRREYERLSRACSPSRGWSGAAASRCRWGSTSGGYAAGRSGSSHGSASWTFAWSATSTSSSRCRCPGVHASKVSVEQQLEAALDGLTFMAHYEMERPRQTREPEAHGRRRGITMSGVRDFLRRRADAGRRSSRTQVRPRGA